MDQDDGSRLLEFRQLKKEIRGSSDHMVVGIDIAKDHHVAFFGTAKGKTLFKRLSFDNTKERFEKLLFHADMISSQHLLKKIVFGIQPTADYHKPLGEYLIRQGHMVVLVAGTAVKKNRELLDGRWDKHDPKDAANVADLVAQGKCLFYEFPSPSLKELRDLLSLKRKLKKQDHAYRVRIRNHVIAQYFPELDTYYKCGEGPSIVKWCIDPQELALLPFKDFVCMVSSRNGGLIQQRRLGEIYRKAGLSIGCRVHHQVAFEAKLLLGGLDQMLTMIRETDTRIASVCQRFPEYPFLLSIPGFGPDISAKVLGALGNPYRFENHRQVLKTAGLDLSADRSGKKQDVTPVISKRGKADLRYGLYQAALVATSKNHHFKEYFTHILTPV